MRSLLTALIALAFPSLTAAQHRAENQAAIYALVLGDVGRSLATPAVRPRQLPALVPFAFPVEQLRTWEPGPAAEAIPDSVLRILQRELTDLTLCRPLPDHACRGEIRGAVLRVSALPASPADTVEVHALLTQARGQHDYTVLVPRPLTYRYVVVRDRTGWRIVAAERARPDPRTA